MLHLDEFTERWFAIYTRYKSEKYVQKMLSIKGVHAYLPLQKRYRFWGGRRRILELPLIACYVFVKIKKEKYIPVLETENVYKFVKIANKLTAIPEEEIDILKKIVGDVELEVTVEPHQYEVGDKVEIIHGSLTGVKGKLVENNLNKFVIIELQHIGYSLRVNIQNNQLRKVLF